MKESDRSRIKGLIQILDSGTFPLKAKEIPAFYSVYKWVQSLEDRIEKAPAIEKVAESKLPEEGAE